MGRYTELQARSRHRGCARADVLGWWGGGGGGGLVGCGVWGAGGWGARAGGVASRSCEQRPDKAKAPIVTSS